MAWALPLLVAARLAAPTEPVPSASPAEPSPRSSELALSWQAPEICPAQAVVIERVEGLLGRTLGETEDPPVRVEARVTEHAGQLTLSLETETAEGRSEREMSGQTCDVLIDAAALVIAVALDPSLAFGEPEPEPEPEPKPEPEPEPEPIPDLITEPRCIEPDPIDFEIMPPPDPNPIAGTVRVAGTGSLGPLPSIAPGVEVVAGFVRRQVRLELGFDYFFARQVTSGGDDRGGEIQLWTVTARGCFVPGVSILEFPVCAGVQTGPMRGEGYGLGAPRSTRLAWVAAEAGGALVVRGLPLVDLWLGADLVVPLTRPGFFIDDVGLVHRSRSIGGEASAGIEIRFGPGRELKRRSRGD